MLSLALSTLILTILASASPIWLLPRQYKETVVPTVTNTSTEDTLSTPSGSYFAFGTEVLPFCYMRLSLTQTK